MTHPRVAYRAAIRAAFEVAPGLAGVTVVKAWRFPRDTDGLPAIGVATPRERVDGSTGSSVDRVVEIAVVLKVVGGDDLEDTLDAYSEVIEAEVIDVLAALDPQPPLYGLTTIDTSIEADANQRVGHLDMRFEATRFADEGAQTL